MELVYLCGKELTKQHVGSILAIRNDTTRGDYVKLMQLVANEGEASRHVKRHVGNAPWQCARNPSLRTRKLTPLVAGSIWALKFRGTL